MSTAHSVRIRCDPGFQVAPNTILRCSGISLDLVEGLELASDLGWAKEYTAPRCYSRRLSVSCQVSSRYLGVYFTSYVVRRVSRLSSLLLLLFLNRVIELMYHSIAGTTECGLSRAPSTATRRYCTWIDVMGDSTPLQMRKPHIISGRNSSLRRGSGLLQVWMSCFYQPQIIHSCSHMFTFSERVLSTLCSLKSQHSAPSATHFQKSNIWLQSMRPTTPIDRRLSWVCSILRFPRLANTPKSKHVLCT